MYARMYPGVAHTPDEDEDEVVESFGRRARRCRGCGWGRSRGLRTLAECGLGAGLRSVSACDAAPSGRRMDTTAFAGPIAASSGQGFGTGSLQVGIAHIREGSTVDYVWWSTWTAQSIVTSAKTVGEVVVYRRHRIKALLSRLMQTIVLCRLHASTPAIAAAAVDKQQATRQSKAA